VPQLRRRLALSGDLTAVNGDDGSLAFDSMLHRAVVRFQHRHGLNEDGVVGTRTLTELNVPVETRIDQIRVNLERGRWLLHDLADTFVAVNIAGAMVYLVRDGDVVHEARAIVGRTYTATPVFTATMQYVDVNPTWTVPPGIVGEVLSAIRRDPGYLRAQNITVLDRSGRVVPASSIDFGRYSARTFPHVFRQEPGPRNPLGVIKFMFPNRHNVYLHDTPSRALFEQEDRLFSHGCIRISDPLRLAELLLAGTTWDRPALEAAVSARGTRTIRLPRPVPVLIQYWTASTDLHRELHFYRDVYGRDAAVLHGLDRQ
jgi:L,D-transpeptidase YcbB